MSNADRYISQNALIKEIAKIRGNLSTKNVGQAIWDTPTADVVEVRHGAWMSAYEYALKIGCTDERRLEEAKADKRWKFCPFCEQQVKWDFNYCPNCGAKMDGERREDER